VANARYGLDSSGILPAAVIVDVVGLSRDAALSDVTSCARHLAGMPLVIYTDNATSAETLRSAHAQHAMSVVFASLDDLPSFAYRACAKAQALLLARAVSDGIADPWLQRVAYCVVASACSDLTVVELAIAVDMTYKRLRRSLAGVDAPGARDLILWGRVLFAAWVLERRWRSVKQLAIDLGWRDDVPLEDAVRRRLRCTPSELRGKPTFPHAMQLFLTEIERRQATNVTARDLHGFLGG
jgi:hypothetical protein